MTQTVGVIELDGHGDIEDEIELEEEIDDSSSDSMTRGGGRAGRIRGRGRGALDTPPLVEPIVAPLPTVVSPPIVSPTSIGSPADLPIASPSNSTASPTSSLVAGSSIGCDLPIIHVEDGRLIPSHACSSTMTKIFMKMIYPNGYTWKNVSNEYKKLYFEEFKKFYKWDESIEAQVRKAFITQAGLCYAHMGAFPALVAAGMEPSGCSGCGGCAKKKKEVCAVDVRRRRRPDVKVKSEQQCKNRMSEVERPGMGCSRHTGGSRSSIEHYRKLWQELEHQALIYKYMVSGMPVPPDLLYSIRRSLDSSLSSKLLLHQTPQHMGWSCFQMGFGKKIDPEPGRCRRTDGKKWRCSKEAYPDSKYCERHMHRGRNRSRKPVEGIALSSQDHTANFLLDSVAYSRNNGYGHGMKDEVDEHVFFSSEGSGSIRSSISGSNNSVDDSSWQLAPLTMASPPLGQLKQRDYCGPQNGGGSKTGVGMMINPEDQQQQPKKVMHHFFDEWPKENKDSWLDSGDKYSARGPHLSISVPNSSHDFFITHNGMHFNSHLKPIICDTF
nr:growth-regulating factor 1-like [Ipomoea batatas]